MIRVDLPYPPSANRLWRAVRGRNIKSAEYRTWMDSAQRSIMAACIGGQLAGPYHMEVQAVRPDRRRRDVSNLLKATEDAIVQSGLVADDSDAQSVKISWAKGNPVKGGKIHVWLWRDE